jgi:hypothetical protein
MHPLKSSRPDGFGVSFFQQHWGIIGDKVRMAILNFLNGGSFDPVINETFIMLIPKTPIASSVGEYRPISLCNVLYKLIAKVLANRLKTVLHPIISHNQSAFVPGRFITDNVLVAYEVLHSMHTRMRSKRGYMAVKLDMWKAYDWVEWSFLEAMMRALDFEEKWIALIMTCVKSVSYSVLVNGVPYGKIWPSKGLRQGDPLSPYLFLIVAEGLSSLLTKAELDSRISGVPISVGAIKSAIYCSPMTLYCFAGLRSGETFPKF